MAQGKANAPVSEEKVVNGVNGNEGIDNNASGNNVSHQNIVKKLIASGCKRINSIRIKNVNYEEKDNYTRISFTLSSPVRGYVSKDNGATYEFGMTNTMFTSLFAITGALKEDEELSWMANALLENPQALNLIFNGSNVDILQQEISAGEEFSNPFTTKEDPTIQVYDHDIIINHVIGFKLSKVGQRMADRLADKLMGF